MRKTAVIVNPAAGHGRSGKRWSARSAGLKNALGDFTELRTRRPGHASELCREAIEAGARLVVAVGGDGTWHETVQGFFAASVKDRAGCVLGCFPAGSGCDFARHFRFPPDGEALYRIFKDPAVRRIDVVRAEVAEGGGTRAVHLTNMAAFGLGGDVAETVDRWGKPLGGTLSYLAATLRHLAVSRALPFSVVLDGEALPEAAFHSVLLGNTSLTGGGMLFAPKADAFDGLLDVITVGEMGRFAMIRKLGMLYDGSHIGQEGVGAYQGRRLEVAPPLGSARRFPLNIDGEACGALPAVFEIVPRALPVVLPRL